MSANLPVSLQSPVCCTFSNSTLLKIIFIIKPVGRINKSAFVCAYNTLRQDPMRFYFAFFLKILSLNWSRSISPNRTATTPRVIKVQVMLRAAKPRSRSMGAPRTMAHRF